MKATLAAALIAALGSIVVAMIQNNSDDAQVYAVQAQALNDLERRVGALEGRDSQPMPKTREEALKR
jgi:hypothetical protein